MCLTPFAPFDAMISGGSAIGVDLRDWGGWVVLFGRERRERIFFGVARGAKSHARVPMAGSTPLHVSCTKSCAASKMFWKSENLTNRSMYV